MNQNTIAKEVSISGVGLHSGTRVTVTLKPAPENYGRVVKRVDCPAGEQDIPLLLSSVNAEKLFLQTGLRNQFGHEISTVEHMLSAVFCLNIDNLIIECDGPEFPILDGSAQQWLELLDTAGIAPQSAPAEVLVIETEIAGEIPLQRGDKKAEFVAKPHDDLRYEILLNYGYPTLPNGERVAFTITEQTFRKEIGPAHTFATEEEVKYAQANGLAKGGTLQDALVFTQTGMLNPELVRFTGEPTEPGRHKVLDLIGDLALIGKRLQGSVFVSYPGHYVNYNVARALIRQAA